MCNFEEKNTYEWKRKVLKKVYEIIAQYGTIAYDFERNEERRYYALDYWWLFHLLYEENQDIFETEECEQELTDLLAEEFGLKRSEIRRMRYGQKLYKLWCSWCFWVMKTRGNTIGSLWEGNPLKEMFPNLRKPESILLPWEMTPFWGWESDGKEEDIPECDLVPF